MKKFLILSAVLFSSVSSAQAVECASELPTVRTGHWSYRLIDGRKCWYEGKAMLPKSALRWPDKSSPGTQAPAAQVPAAQAPVARAPAAQVKSAPAAQARSFPPAANSFPDVKSIPDAQAQPAADEQARIPATDGRDFSDPEDGSCCWPPPRDDSSFESRWRSLGLKPAS